MTAGGRAWLSDIMKTMNPIRTMKGATMAALRWRSWRSRRAVATAPTSTEVAAPNSIIAGTVTATRVAGGVAIANGTERAVAYAVANPNWLGLLATCSDPSPVVPAAQAGRSRHRAARRDRRLGRADDRCRGVLVAGPSDEHRRLSGDRSPTGSALAASVARRRPVRATNVAGPRPSLLRPCCCGVISWPQWPLVSASAAGVLLGRGIPTSAYAFVSAASFAFCSSGSGYIVRATSQQREVDVLERRDAVEALEREVVEARNIFGVEDERRSLPLAPAAVAVSTLNAALLWMLLFV